MFSEVEAASQYKRLPHKEKNWMTVPEMGKNLRKWSYSVSEIAELLEVNDTVVYHILKRSDMKVVIVDYWKRVPKKAFQEWYASQSKYRTKEDKKKDQELEGATMTMPEMAR